VVSGARYVLGVCAALVGLVSRCISSLLMHLSLSLSLSCRSRLAASFRCSALGRRLGLFSVWEGRSAARLGSGVVRRLRGPWLLWLDAQAWRVRVERQAPCGCWRGV
jgi:hypothetical protein